MDDGKGSITATFSAEPVSEIDFLLSRKIAQLESETKAGAVYKTLTEAFQLLGSTHYLVTGIPLPKNDLKDHIIMMEWPEADGVTSYKPRAEDIVLQKAIDWPFSFVLKAKFHQESGLARSAQVVSGKRELLVIPIVGIAKFHGVAVLTIGQDVIQPDQQSEYSLRYSTRSLLVSLLHFAFYQLIAHGKLKIKRKGDLTAREKEIVSLSALGRPAADIGTELGISEYTVVAHLRNAAAKLTAANKPECILQAIRYHQIGPGAGRGFYEMEQEIFTECDYNYKEIF